MVEPPGVKGVGLSCLKGFCEEWSPLEGFAGESDFHTSLRQPVPGPSCRGTGTVSTLSMDAGKVISMWNLVYSRAVKGWARLQTHRWRVNLEDSPEAEPEIASEA